MESDKYEAGLSWLYDVMYNTKFTTSRIKTKTNNMLNAIPAYKTSASSILSLMGEGCIYQRGDKHIVMKQ